MQTINVTFGVKKRKDSCEILLQCPDMYFTKMIAPVENLDGKSYEEIEDAIAKRLSFLITKLVMFASRTDSTHPYTKEMKSVCEIGEKKDNGLNHYRDVEAHIHKLVPKDVITTTITQPSLLHRAMKYFGNVWKRINNK